jgi:hypothetical protein
MVTLRRALDRFRAFHRQDHRLRIEQLLQAAAQNRPVFRLDQKVAAKAQHRDLTDLATDALGAHQSVGDVAFTRRLVAGSRLSYEHAHDRTTKETGPAKKSYDYGTTKRQKNPPSAKSTT